MTWSSVLTLILGVFAREIIKVISKWIATRNQEASDHQASVDQAKQDNEKATHITPGSTSDEIDQAGDDSLKHL